MKKFKISNKKKSICNDWEIRIGIDDFLFNFGNMSVSCGTLRSYIKYCEKCVDGYFTPPGYINLCYNKSELEYKINETQFWGKVLSHEFLHYILYKHFGDEIRIKLDRLNHCNTSQLDESGLNKNICRKRDIEKKRR